jgi:hypothetical protein
MDFTGLVLDVYDDNEGQILKSAVPNGDFPDFLKTAQKHSEEELAALPNDAFALRVVNEGKLIRKYAMSDKGNTALSVIYFMSTKDHLPEEAQKVAAANLVEGCVYHDIAPPEALVKLADKQEDDDGIVDVTGKEPMAKVASLDSFHLDSMEKVAAACTFFDENYGNMHPKERRSLAVSLSKLATNFNVDTSERLDKYGAASYAPNLAMGMTLREQHLDQDDTEGRELLHSLYKHASTASPEAFAEALAEFDKGTGLSKYWDRGLPDPWYSTFGHVKFAEFTFIDGADRVTATDLHLLAQNPILLSESFSKDIVSGFKSDPVGIFESMPLPQKRIIMRLASNEYTGGVNARTSEG